MEVINVDYRAASLYLALTVDRDELIREGREHLLASKCKTRGRKPTVRCGLMAGPLSREERREGDSGSNQEARTELEWEMEEELEVGARLDGEPPKESEVRWRFPR